MRIARRECARCLFFEGIEFYLSRPQLPRRMLRRFAIEDDGVCSICRAYERAFDAESIARQLDRFLVEARAGARIGLALSGGEDSLACLQILRAELGLSVRALLFDNGFIPGSVLERARAACDALDTPLEIVTSPDVQDALTRALDEADPEAPAPCDVCGRAVSRALESRDVDWWVLGTNYFIAWDVRPFAVAEKDGRRWIHLPYAMRRTHADTRRAFAALHLTGIDLPGVSTNCTLPGRLARTITQTLGHVPEREDLSLEVLVGYLTRDEALQVLG